jgi:hypothetical protein
VQPQNKGGAKASPLKRPEAQQLVNHVNKFNKSMNVAALPASSFLAQRLVSMHHASSAWHAALLSVL